MSGPRMNHPSLKGRALPRIDLMATTGEYISLDVLPGKSVLFIYPYTGVPGVPDPEGWDHIPGAHGSTPQALAFSYRYQEFVTLDVKVFGLSFQDTIWQQEFVARNKLAFPLLSDFEGRFATALSLEAFSAGAKNFLTRRTFIIENGIITHDFYPVPKPAANADDVLQVLKS
jgi:peroxiredoxin